MAALAQRPQGQGRDRQVNHPCKLQAQSHEHMRCFIGLQIPIQMPPHQPIDHSSEQQQHQKHRFKNGYWTRHLSSGPPTTPRPMDTSIRLNHNHAMKSCHSPLVFAFPMCHIVSRAWCSKQAIYHVYRPLVGCARWLRQYRHQPVNTPPIHGVHQTEMTGF